MCASFILFQGFNTTDAVNTISLLSGFLVIFAGVYLLNLCRGDSNGHQLLTGHIDQGVPTDGIASLQTRRSMQIRRNGDACRISSGSARFSSQEDRERLIIQPYEEEDREFGLRNLTEGSEDNVESAFCNVNGPSSKKI